MILRILSNLLVLSRKPVKGHYTGWYDGKSRRIYIGDICKTHDSRGRVWYGEIVIVDQQYVISGANPLFAFKSNYETWINNQEYASELEVIK